MWPGRFPLISIKRGRLLRILLVFAENYSITTALSPKVLVVVPEPCRRRFGSFFFDTFFNTLGLRGHHEEFSFEFVPGSRGSAGTLVPCCVAPPVAPTTRPLGAPKWNHLDIKVGPDAQFLKPNVFVSTTQKAYWHQYTVLHAALLL